LEFLLLRLQESFLTLKLKTEKIGKLSLICELSLKLIPKSSFGIQSSLYLSQTWSSLIIV
jgi:hypothetical protein